MNTLDERVREWMEGLEYYKKSDGAPFLWYHPRLAFAIPDVHAIQMYLASLQSRKAELARAKRNGYITGALQHKVDRRIANLDKLMETEKE